MLLQKSRSVGDSVPISRFLPGVESKRIVLIQEWSKGQILGCVITSGCVQEFTRPWPLPFDHPNNLGRKIKIIVNLFLILNAIPGGFRKEVRHLERLGDVSSHRTLDPHGSTGVSNGEARQVVELVVDAPQEGVNAVPFALVRQPSFGGVDEVFSSSHDIGLGACIWYEKVNSEYNYGFILLANLRLTGPGFTLLLFSSSSI